jgi:hypothetical protein
MIAIGIEAQCSIMAVAERVAVQAVYDDLCSAQNGFMMR